jgi:hypothetical protein
LEDPFFGQRGKALSAQWPPPAPKAAAGKVIVQTVSHREIAGYNHFFFNGLYLPVLLSESRTCRRDPIHEAQKIFLQFRRFGAILDIYIYTFM